jgi:hypothetical protein
MNDSYETLKEFKEKIQHISGYSFKEISELGRSIYFLETKLNEVVLQESSGNLSLRIHNKETSIPVLGLYGKAKIWLDHIEIGEQFISWDTLKLIIV